MEKTLEIEETFISNNKTKDNFIKNFKFNEKHVIFIVMSIFITLIALFLIFPLITVVLESFKTKSGIYSLHQYKSIFTSKFLLGSIKNTLEIAIFSSLVTVILSTITAYSITKLDNKYKDKFLLFSNMVANFAGVPLAFAFIIVFGYSGFMTKAFKFFSIFETFEIYNKAGVNLLYIYFLLPLGVLLTYPAFEKLKPEWSEAASVLGASRFSYWLHVGIPNLLPNIFGTFIILFADAMGAHGTIYALTSGNYNVLSIRIGNLLGGDAIVDHNLASALAVILGLTLITTFIANEKLIQRGRKRNGKRK